LGTIYFLFITIIKICRDSITKARELAREEGLSEEQIKFETSSSTNYPFYPEINQRYDLITFFDCLHDMGDPVGTASHALKSLKPDGTVMIVEPFANDRLDNLNPLGKILCCFDDGLCSCFDGCQRACFRNTSRRGKDKRNHEGWWL
jgi:hypothetical protein